MQSKMKPYNGHILIEPIKEKLVMNKSGLALTSKAKDEMTASRAKVIQVSNEADDAGIKPGDIVQYRVRRSFEIMLPPGEMYSMIRLDDVFIVE